MTKKTKSDQNLTKLKLALATGGMMVTIIGATLLGKEAGTLTANNSVNTNTASGMTTGSGSILNLDTTIPESLDLKLEAIPTVSAPTVRNVPIAMGRSSR
ncbi:MAG: hypothetical protein KC423_11325 [Anaerolineales bacterium]|nr:hypothetical protein [Anaerolineales bacterium]